MKTGYLNPAAVTAPFALWQQWGQMVWESHMIIAMRTAGMMGVIKQDADEPQRMVMEKADAATEAMEAAMRAAARGARADQIMAAALRPYRRRTKANAKRLASRS